MSSGILAALGSSFCCWGPALLAGVAGLTGTATLFSWLYRLKPYLAIIAAVSLGTAFYKVYRESEKQNSGCQYCVAQQKQKTRVTKAVLWTVTAFALLSFSYPYYSAMILSNHPVLATKNEQTLTVRQASMMQSSDTTEQEQKVHLKVTGMHCNGCANRCQKVLFDFNGVTNADVSYENEAATIHYHPDSTDVSEIIQHIEEIGFHANKMKSDE